MERIELSEEHVGRRAVAAVLFLIIGAVALGYAIHQVSTPQAGWQTIEAAAKDGPNCGEEFVFLYEFGAGGQPVLTERRALNALYSQACTRAFQLFHTNESFEGVVNLRDINGRPNEALEVDPALYRAFEAVQEAGDRTVYLGPVCARYNDLFYCQDDVQLVDFDPRLSDEVRAEYAAIAAFAADPRSIDVELLGEDKLCLRVSEEYLTYARENGIDRFLDFGWMKNAFVTDYLAQTMLENGYTHGAISSRDGFARCLDSREETGYSLPLLDWLEDRPIEAGTLNYRGPMSIVSLRSFPAAAGDEYRYYRLKNGETRTLYLDPADGVCRLDADSVTCCSSRHSCARLAMEMGRAYIADPFRDAPQAKLIQEGAAVITCRSGEHRLSTFGRFGGQLSITGLYKNENGVRYTVNGDP